MGRRGRKRKVGLRHACGALVRPQADVASFAAQQPRHVLHPMVAPVVEQSVRPGDLPPNGSLTLQADGRSASVSEIFPLVVGDSLDLVVKYKVPSIADTAQTFASNMAVIKALVARYPELRGAFSAVVARAVAPSGEDYGSLLAMKDVK